MMGLSVRSRHWLVLQVVAIVVCYRGNVLSERSQGCVGSQLSLRCPEMKVIQITAVVLGDTYCQGTSCCIKDDDCIRNANENHRTDVHSRCDNKQSCTVGVLQEKISCGYWGVWYKNDFERITYNCINDPQRSTTATFSMPYSTKDILRTEENTPEKGTENAESSTKDSYLFWESTTSSTNVQNDESSARNISGDVENVTHEDRAYNPLLLSVAMTTVCLVVFIAIVVVVVIKRRKRRPKVSVAVEMTENGSSDLNQTVDTNENQTMSLNNGNGSPIYSNDRIEKSRDKGAKGTDTYEDPNNAVHSLANGAVSRPTEDLIVLENSEPTYQVPRPRSDVYSLARVAEEPECAGSTADASKVDNNVYCNVETRETAKAANSSVQNDYEVCNWKKSEYKAVRADETIPPAQKKSDSPAHRTSQDSYTKVNKPSKKETAFDSSGKVEAKDKLNTSDGFPNPTYVTMSPGMPESIYANSPPLSPSCSVASKALSTGGPETENPYCEMRSPSVKFKDDGN